MTRKCLETHVLNLKSQSGDEAVFQTMHVAKPQTVERCSACNQSRCSRACVSRTTRTISTRRCAFLSFNPSRIGCVPERWSLRCGTARVPFDLTGRVKTGSILKTSSGFSSPRQAKILAEQLCYRQYFSRHTRPLHAACHVPGWAIFVAVLCYRRQPLPLDTCRVACCIVYRMFDCPCCMLHRTCCSCEACRMRCCARHAP